ncbi:zinc-dependent metalloprotease [Alteromonas sp. 5E99-2]|uniref:zinc-dependent metalloprotease n=1 Tax=Alteromonas sp. 5E99-2 TaxID=2817683 RepID=UPI001A9A21A6|nr:zinc-dependent metalloprotease [Alteromonas sp. 5E99-2]MBO1256936.1 zinc-dependent metalloprotease [Alteromonas sp. 5E99-2]
MFNYRKRIYLISLLVMLAPFAAYVHGKDNAEKANEEEDQTLSELLEIHTQFSGFFDIYRDEKDGSGFLLIDESQLNVPFLYFVSTIDGVVSAGTFRGDFRDSRLLQFRRNFDRIEIVSKTPRFYFDPDNAVSRAASANISEAVLVSTKIEHEEEGKIAISLSDVFKNEQLHRITNIPANDPKIEKKRFKLGKLSKDKTTISEISNFPSNTHVIVDYVYDDAVPKVSGGSDLSDQRYTTLSIQHAFIEAPNNNYVARRDDARVGYFSQQFDDLTSDQTANYRDVINRWHLEKKDPSAAISDPIQPIVWWIENTTPVEWRETIKNATLAWNSAFEKAGFSNAIEVKIQPDDATWSANDVRYNVLRWTSSPRPPFGGYGPSLAHPITGQIIAADIMLEYSFMKGRWIAGEMFTDGANLSTGVHDSHDALKCSLGYELNMGLLFGQMGSLADGLGEIEKEKLLRQSMSYLILHEVGHTLGLNHNMMATQLHNHDDAHNPDITNGILAGSVMDYPSVNYAPVGVTQGDFYTEKPGPYDDWVIQYGYSTALDDPIEEEARLTNILNMSAQPELAFGNDADDMRSPGRHVDPRINIFDMSSDAVEYAQDRFVLIKHMSGKLKDKLLLDGRSHNDLVVGVNVLFGEFSRQAAVVSRYVGGVYLNRAYVGQDGYTQPLTPVPLEEQELAMATLSDYVFAPDAISEMEPLFAYLQRQRRGFSGFGRDESPKIHSMLLNTQKNVLAHLMHPNVASRITDTALYGNQFTIEKMLSSLTDSIFAEDMKASVNSYRRNIQVEYVERLIAMAGLEKPSNYDNFSKAAANYELNKLQSLMKTNRGDQGTKVHRAFVKDRLNRAFHKSKT